MPLSSGTSLGPYTILSPLGAGGMGEVYLGRDTRLDRMVAIKVLPSHSMGNAEAIERFEREARAISRLNHPNVCTLYDVGQVHDVRYLVMEYLEGRSLSQIVATGRLSVSEAVRYGRQIAEALAKAHSAGIIHRDLKPANVIITSDGTAKVLDFGLARRQPTEEEATRGPVTDVGCAVGTPQYMSPEQLMGEHIDIRTDVFSFGVLLYELLTGARPFTGSNVFSIAQRIQEARPTPLADLRPDVPREVTAVVDRALAKDPGERFQSGGELLAALRAVELVIASRELIVDGRAPATSSSSVGRSTRLSWLLTVAAGLGMLSALTWGVLRSSDPQQIDDAASTAATASSLGAFQWAQRGYASLSRYDVPDNVDRAIEEFRNAVTRDASNAYAHAGLAQAYQRKHSATPDPQIIRLAAAAAQHAVELNPDLSAAHLAVAVVRSAEGRQDEAQRALEKARELDPRNAHVRMWMGELLRLQRRIDDADAQFREAVTLAADDWVVHQYRGRLLYGASRFQEAVDEWERARALTPDNVLVLRNLSAAYHMIDRVDDAAAALQRALEIRPAATIYTNLGTLRFFQGQYQQAVTSFERAVEMNPTYYLYWGNLADGHRWVPGHEKQATEAYARASQLAAEWLTKAPDDLEVRALRAVYLVKAGRRDEASEEVARVEAASNRSAASYFKSLLVHEIGGRRENALRDLEKALSAGYALREIANEPELIGLRSDSRYHRIVVKFQKP